MAEHDVDISNGESRLRLDAPGALSSIGYNSILAADQGTSSEEELLEEEEIPADDARTAIGVSISSEQARLTSPKTPAIEKAAAIENAGGFFGRFDGAEDTLVEEPEDQDDEYVEKIQDEILEVVRNQEDSVPDQPSKPSVPERATRKTEVQLPSPWRAEQNEDWQMAGRKSGLLNGLFNRRRAASGPESMLQWQRSLLPSLPGLPSMPKHLSFSPSFFGSQDAHKEPTLEVKTQPERSSVQFPDISQRAEFGTSTTIGRQRAESDGRAIRAGEQVSLQETEATRNLVGSMESRPSVQTVGSRATLLRRSASDQSLVTQRTLSRVESFGDDSRFEHVQDQVNSRFKAIRDSWQDANIRLPSLPNFNVAQFTPEFFRERSGSANRRSGARQLPGRASSSDINSSSSRSARPVDHVTRQPYSSANAAHADTANRKPGHPRFNRALEQLEGDVVILGGYRGSILRSAEPPHRQVWVPVKAGLNLRRVNLEVGLRQDDDERATKTIIPGGMLTHIGPVDIARRLFKRLRSCENVRAEKLRVHDYGYDWRLMPTYLSKQLIRFLEKLPCNRSGVPKEKRGAIVIAHSLGGLITRHAVNQRPELFRGVVYAGVPNTCVNILGPMRNGDDVLLSTRVLTAQVNFSIRTSFVLLPLDGRCFFDKETREEYPVDFFDVNTWIDLRLSPCVGRPLPPLNAQPKPTGITGYVSSMASALPNLYLPGRKSSASSRAPVDPSRATMIAGTAEPDTLAASSGDNKNTAIDDDIKSDSNDTSASVSTAVTIPREEAMEYLQRTLASIKQFKQELAFDSAHASSNIYPPVSVIYGKSTPTVYGAKVHGREGIKHSDAYDELAFASGDGVVLARAAMMPQGYTTARGGTVASDRGHVTLLGDLEAVGKCLNAVISAKRKGVGCGIENAPG